MASLWASGKVTRLWWIRWDSRIPGNASLPTKVVFAATKTNNIDPAERIRLLRKVAAINLKKSPGGGSADPESILSVARADQDLIREQVRLYDADITICCGAPVGQLLEELLLVDLPGKWAPTSRGVYFKQYFKQNGSATFVVDYVHPQIRMWHHLVDESGEDYLFDKSQFVFVDFPNAVKKKILAIERAS